MGNKGYKKWWRPGDVPVVFVAPGVDPATARRQYGDRQYWGKKRGGGLNGEFIIAIVSLVVLMLGGVWYWRKPVQADDKPRRGRVAMSITKTPTSTASTAPTTIFVSATRTPHIRPPWFTPTHTPTVTPTPTPSPSMTPPLAGTTLNSPMQPPVVVVVTATPTPTSTPAPYTYEVIANYTQPESLYSFISGWIVEPDGKTPRPVAVDLIFATGKMTFPRPNNVDVATGYFEFMVSPGDYLLRVRERGAPNVPVHIGLTPVRHEISFRRTGPGPIITPVHSSPWAYGTPAPTPTPAPTSTPTPTSTATLTPQMFNLFLPVVMQ